MIQLPYSDELNIGYLSRLFDDTSNCYKFFWFQAILRKLTPEHTRLYCDGLSEDDFRNRLYNVITLFMMLRKIADFGNGYMRENYVGNRV